MTELDVDDRLPRGNADDRDPLVHAVRGGGADAGAAAEVRAGSVEHAVDGLGDVEAAVGAVRPEIADVFPLRLGQPRSEVLLRVEGETGHASPAVRARAPDLAFCVQVHLGPLGDRDLTDPREGAAVFADGLGCVGVLAVGDGGTGAERGVVVAPGVPDRSVVEQVRGAEPAADRRLPDRAARVLREDLHADRGIGGVPERPVGGAAARSVLTGEAAASVLPCTPEGAVGRRDEEGLVKGASLARVCGDDVRENAGGRSHAGGVRGAGGADRLWRPVPVVHPRLASVPTHGKRAAAVVACGIDVPVGSDSREGRPGAHHRGVFASVCPGDRRRLHSADLVGTDLSLGVVAPAVQRPHGRIDGDNDRVGRRGTAVHRRRRGDDGDRSGFPHADAGQVMVPLRVRRSGDGSGSAGLGLASDDDGPSVCAGERVCDGGGGDVPRRVGDVSADRLRKGGSIEGVQIAERDGQGA
ncbi:hypothetical protein ABE10_03315 [Bacillus toyonensis]|nr:hypothetical protein [Bacillus toyonensis]